MAPETCPNCGADVPPRAKACPECGSDEKTGWSEQAAYDGLGLPDEAFDYDDFVKQEFGDGPRRSGVGSWIWIAIALIATVALAAVILF
jgi:hypothetical protein